MLNKHSKIHQFSSFQEIVLHSVYSDQLPINYWRLACPQGSGHSRKDVLPIAVEHEMKNSRKGQLEEKDN